MEKDIEINEERNAQKNRLLHLLGSFLVIFTTSSTHCKKHPPTHLWSPKCIQRRRDPAKPPRCESPGTESHKKKNECLFGRDTWKKSNLKKEAELLVVRLHWLILWFVFNKMALGWKIIAIKIPKKSTSPPLFLQKQLLWGCRRMSLIRGNLDQLDHWQTGGRRRLDKLWFTAQIHRVCLKMREKTKSKVYAGSLILTST